MRKIKFGFLAVLLMLPMVVHSPQPEDRNLAGLTASGYIKVYATDSLFNDRFSVYVFGKAERWKVYNPTNMNIPYNEISYMKLDNKHRIVDVKTEDEL